MQPLWSHVIVQLFIPSQLTIEKTVAVVTIIEKNSSLYTRAVQQYSRLREQNAKSQTPAAGM